MICLERQSYVSSGVPAGLGAMKHVGTLLDTSQNRSLQTLYQPLQSSLYKLKKIRIKMDSLFDQASEISIRLQDTLYEDDTGHTEATLSHYLDLLRNASRAYGRQYGCYVLYCIVITLQLTVGSPFSVAI